MPDAIPLFELTRETIEITIEDLTTGRPIPLRHVFRPPTDAEWIAYMQEAAGVRVTNGTVEPAAAMRAELDLWTRLILSVDDRYTWEGEPIMQKRPEDWKDKLPASHKYLAVRGILAVRQRVVEGPLA